ncbi:MAG: 50S ribosomal protein L24 [Gammaproteobacteria bacterium]|nr:50S ribosomal protein L24 [Gammaproteobacteria bacterium]MBU1481778.1 50S ribosomal protein L24 [Gammaproteobacteria bacterium]
MNKIKKNDDVIVITGKDKGSRGSVLSVLNNDRVLVAGINKVKKHQKPNPVKGTSGGIVEIEKPIHISNIAIYNAATKKADRVGVKQLEDGRKVRVFKSNGEVIA